MPSLAKSTGSSLEQEAKGLRLHIGGRQPKPGWKILNVQPGPDVDFIGNCTSLAQFADESVAEVHASHVYEHLGFREELPRGLKEVWRVLEPGGVFRISVPDFEILCRLLVDPRTPADKKYSLMMHVFGAQEDPCDVHRVGLTEDFLSTLLRRAGFSRL